MKHLSTSFILFLAVNLFGQISSIDDYSFESCPNFPGQNQFEEIEFVLPTSDGGYLLVGYFTHSEGNIDGVVRKVSSTGEPQWCDTQGGPDLDYFRSATELNGNYYIVGSKEDSQGWSKLWVLKYSLNGGNPIVEKTDILDGIISSESRGYTVEATYGENIVVGGVIDQNGDAAGFNTLPSLGFLVAVFFDDLNIYPNTFTTVGRAVYKIEQSQFPEEEYYWVFGGSDEFFGEICDEPNFNGSLKSNIPFNTFSDIFAAKYDISLHMEDSYLIGGETPDKYIDAIAIPDGGFAILGQTECPSVSGDSGPDNICFNIPNDYRPYWVYKGNTQGSAQWIRSHDNPNDLPFGLVYACDLEGIVYGALLPYFEDGFYVKFYEASSLINPPQLIGTSTNFDYSALIAYDLKRGHNQELVVGGNYSPFFQWWEENLWFARFTTECNDPCLNPHELTCGEPQQFSTIESENDFGGANISCTNNPYSAPDELFYLDKQEEGDLVITLFSNNIDLDIFLFRECVSNDMVCENYSIEFVHNSGLNQEVIVVPDAETGDYFIVVDGKFAWDVGAFTLTATCGEFGNCFNDATFISCGTELTNENNWDIFYDNKLSRYCGVVDPGSGTGCTGPERLYRFSVQGTQEIFLELIPEDNSDDFEMFLMKNNCNSQNCIASSTNPPGEIDTIQETLTQGTYYLVVDGWRETEGSYNLKMSCCPDPEKIFDCGNFSYNHISGLTYSFSVEDLPDYANGESWLINDMLVNPVNYTFPEEGTFEVCAPFSSDPESGCFDYCCITYCIAELNDCLEGLIPSCESECFCTESGDMYLPPPFMCESFNGYMSDTTLAQQSGIWSTIQDYDDGNILAAGEVEKYLHLAYEGNQPPGLIYEIANGNGENLECGRYRLSWLTNVSFAATGGINILYDKAGGLVSSNIAASIQFEMNGTGQITTWDSDEAASVMVPFNYFQGYWSNIMFIVDLEKGRLEFWLNGQMIHFMENFGTSLSGAIHNPATLGGIAFAGDSNADFYIDNICIRTTDPDYVCASEGEMVCVENGESYENACEAGQVGLYTEGEFEVCLSICNLSGEFIGRSDNINISNVLNSYELAPNMIYSETGILEYYGNEAPYPLYSDLYIFQNEQNGIINIQLPENLDAFVYRCDCDNNGCTSEFIGDYVSISGNQQDAGFYYILVVSETPNESYGITISPSGDCNMLETDALSCGSTVTRNFEGLPEGFAYDENAVAGCYNGNRDYTGLGRVFRLKVDQASIVDIQLNIQSGVGGMFLFASSCGNDCIGYGETSSNGGLASISNVHLANGFYYIVVFQENGTSISSFDLNVTCSPDADNASILNFLDESCETDQDSFHVVAFNFDGVNIPDLSSDDIFSLNLKPLNNTSDLSVINPNISASYAGGESIVFPYLFEYNGDDVANRCSFIQGDTMVLYIERGEGLVRPCTAYFSPDSENPDNLENVFNPGDTSEIINFEIQEAGVVMDVFPTTDWTFHQEVTSQSFYFSVGTNQGWELIPSDDWITLSQNGVQFGPQLVNIEVDPTYNGYEPRTGTVIWQLADMPIFAKTISITQLPPCRDPEIVIEGLIGDTLKVCDGQPIIISADIPGLPTGQYNFYWNDENIPGETTRDLSGLSAGVTEYSLLVEQKTCVSSQDIFSFFIDVEDRPETPQLNSTDIIACGDDTSQFQIIDQQTGVDYWWRDASGNIEQNGGIDFKPMESGVYSVEAYSTNNQECISEVVNLNYSIVEDIILTNSEMYSGCVGSSIPISVTSNVPSEGLVFSWSDGIEGVSADVDYVPDQPGENEIMVYASNENCVSDTITIVVNVGVAPPQPIVVDKDYCPGDEPVALVPENISQDYATQWFYVEEGGDPIPTGEEFYPDTTGTYWVEFANDYCSSNRVSVNYTIGEPFELALASGAYETCQWDQLDVMAVIDGNSTNLEYSWSGDVSTGGQVVTFLSSNEGNQIVELTASNGICTENDQIEILVGASNIPSPETGDNNFVYCEDELNPTVSVEVHNPDVFTAFWYDGPDQSSNLVETGPNFVNPPPGNYYIYTVDNDVNICTSSIPLTLSVSEVGAIDAEIFASDTLNCEEELIVMSVQSTGGSAPENLLYNWNESLGQESTVDLLLEAGPNTYFVTVTDSGSSCTDIAAVTLQGIPEPEFFYVTYPHCISTQAYSFSIASEGDQVIIQNGTGVINQNGNVYEFIIPTGESIDVRILNQLDDVICDTMINIQALECSCFGTVVQNAQAVVDTVEVCDGFVGELMVQPPIGDNVVYWFENPSTNGLPLDVGVTLEEEVAGTYYAFIWDPEQECFGDFDAVTLLVNDLPIADAGDDIVACFGDLVTLDGTGSSGVGPLEHEWTSLVEIINNTSPNPYLVALDSSIFIALQVTDGNGCVNSNAVHVMTTEPSNIDIVQFQEILCFGDSTGQLGAIVTSDYEPVVLEWSTGETGIVISDLPAGVYELTVIDSIGCMNQDSFVLNQPPEFVFSDTLVTPISYNEEGILYNSGKIKYTYSGGTPPFEFSWYRNDTLVSTGDSIFTTLIPGDVYLEIVDANGCIFTYDTTIVTGVSFVEDLGQLTVSPNPFSERFFVETEFNRSVNLVFYVYNGLGEMVKRTPYYHIMQDRIEIDLQDYPDGHYWLRINVGEAIITRKILKMR